MKQPKIYYEGEYTEADLNDLKDKNSIWRVSDIYRRQIDELFEIQNPSLIGSKNYDSALKQFIQNRVEPNETLRGNWVYFPWSGVLTHMVGKNEFDLLRTNRNRNIIMTREQEKLSGLTIGILGLSVGGNMAVTLAQSNIASNMKLADFDTLDTSNLNRIRASVDEVGSPKIDITSQQIYEINPYASLHLFCKGVDKNNLSKFCLDNPRPDVIIEAIDDFEIKVRLRLLAKEARIPVIMLTNLGDSVLVDVERHDQEDIDIFNGLIGEAPEEIINNPIGEREKIKFAMQIVGIDNIPTRALGSLLEIRKTLVGRPQLASTVAIGGGVSAYLIRKFALGSLPSGRSILSLNTSLGLQEDEGTLERGAIIDKLKKLSGI